MVFPGAVTTLWNDLETARAEVLAEVDGISQAQADWKPTEKDWSLGEIIHHLTVAEIATGKLKPGDTLPSVRALARQLRIHHNTVSQAYNDVTALYLLLRKHGSRLVVRSPEDRAGAAPTFPWLA